MILVHPSTEAEYVAKGFQLVLGAPALGIGLFLVSWWGGGEIKPTPGVE